MGHTPYIDPVSGKEWPSITRVCDVLAKPGLYKFYAQHGQEGADKIKNDSADIGSAFHEEVFHRLNGSVNPNKLTPQVQKMIDTFFDKFVKPYKVAPLQLETKVVSNEYRTHGTFDGIVSVTDLPIGRARTKYTGTVLVDWKTANGIYDTNGIQLGGYWLCLPNPPTDGLIVQIDRDTCEIRKKLFPDLRWYAEEFKACRDLHDYVNHAGAWER